MKKNLLMLFLLFSFCLHLIIFAIKFPANKPESKPIKIDIVQKDTPPPVAAIKPPPEELPKVIERPKEIKPVTPKAKDIPNTPKPKEKIPIVIDNVLPQTDGGKKGDTNETTKPNNEEVVSIKSKKEIYSENPPKPLDDEEFIKERAAQGKEDIDINKIIRDYARENQQKKTTGEDTYSFSELNLKYDSYFFKFARNLYGEWNYPNEAVEKGQSGIVRVSFSIFSDGKITNVKITESSGYPVLDKEVLRTLKTMSGVPLPETYALEVLNVNAYFIYTLTGDYRLY